MLLYLNVYIKTTVNDSFLTSKNGIFILFELVKSKWSQSKKLTSLDYSTEEKKYIYHTFD